MTASTVPFALHITFNGEVLAGVTESDFLSAWTDFAFAGRGKI